MVLDLEGNTVFRRPVMMLYSGTASAMLILGEWEEVNGGMGRRERVGVCREKVTVEF